MKANRKIILFLTVILFCNFYFSPLALAEINSSFGSGLNATAEQTGHLSARLKATPVEIIGKVIGYILSFLGVIFLILMIYAGYLWMLARGNEQEVERAKNLIRDAIIGLIIVLAAYAITYFLGDTINQKMGILNK